MLCIKLSNGNSFFEVSPKHCIADYQENYHFALDFLNKVTFGTMG